MKTESIQKRKRIMTCLLALLTFCLVLTGIFFIAPIKAHAASDTCPICSNKLVTVLYSKGICAKNGEHYQTPDTDSTNYDVDGDGTPDTVYLIANTGNLLWLAQQVNAGTGREYNAVLTADISLRLGSIREGFTLLPWTPIGTDTSTSYMGIFDGNGKTITYLNHTDTTVDYVGLFGYVNGGTVKDLTIGSSTLKGNDYVGGIAGALTGGATVENCIVIGTITGTNNVGGVAGYVEASTIENCYSKATVSGTTKVGGIAGNVFSTTSVIDNCYYLNTSASVGFNGSASNGSVVATTSAQESSGELAFLLGDAFGQAIDSGSRQTRPYVGGTKVYKALSCEGDGTVIYTNEPNRENLATHLWNTAGFCQTNDSHYQPATLTTDAHDIDGDGAMDQVYEISNAGQLYWFAAQVNGGNTAINGILTTNITVNSSATFTEEGTTATNVRSWTPIGTNTNPFTGIFDGNGKTVSKLYISASNLYNGLFGYSKGEVKNVGVANSYFKGRNSTAAIVGANYGNVYNCFNNNTYCIGTYHVGGIVGYHNDGTVKNCWTNGYVEGTMFAAIVSFTNNDKIENCFYLEGVASSAVYTTGYTFKNVGSKSAEQFASGEVAYLLGSAWGQNIDSGTAQSYPVLGGKAVYQNNEADAYCDAYVYSNTDTDIFPTKHYYDTTTGVCSHCEYQGEARIGEVVYNTFAEAFEAAKGLTRPTITVLKSIDVGNVTYSIEGESMTIEGSENIRIGGNGAEFFVFESYGGSIELKNITVYSTNEYGAPVAARNGGYILISQGAILRGEGCESGAHAIDGGYIQLQGGRIENVKYGIQYGCINGTEAEVVLLYGTIEATDYSVYYSVGGRACVGTVGLLKYVNTYVLELSAPIFLSTGSNIVCSNDLSNWGPFEIEMETPGKFLTANSTSSTLDRTQFISVDEDLYVQYNSNSNYLYLGKCDHGELSYVKTGNYKVTETCAVCEGVNEVELHAPADLVYSASAKQATVTGSFFHTAPSAITYCCEGGCKNVSNGKTHTATVTIGTYTLKKTFVIEKAPGVAAVTIQGWKLGDTPNAPVPSSSTNANGITYYYKLANADDSTYTQTVPTEEGQYILKAVFAAGDNYAEVTAYASFAIGKEMPEYTVPTGLSATYGDLLSSVTLPAGWSWKDGEQTVGNAGTNEFVAVFTPEDTDTYLSPEVLVQVEVAKADVPEFTLSQSEFTYVEGMTINLNDYLGGGGGDGKISWSVIKDIDGVAFEFDRSTGMISEITLAGGTFRVAASVLSTDNYNFQSTFFTITILKGTQNFTVSQSIQSPTIVNEVELIANGNAGAVTYTTTEQYLTIDGNALTATKVGAYTITATAAATDLYESATQTFTVTFGKAAGNFAPDYELPTGLTVCVGKSTNDITLPTGWSFATATTFNSVGVKNVSATFTPADTTNYNTYGVSVTVTVNDHVGGAAPTCTTAQICTVCGEVLVKPLDHDFENSQYVSMGEEGHTRKCSRCDEYEKTAPHYSEDEATCTASRICTECGEVIEEALGHNYTERENNTIRTTAQNCQEYNTYWYDCSRCGQSAKNDASATDKWYTSNEAGAHSMSSDWTSENGQHFHKCTVDGCTYTDTKVNCSGGTPTCQAKAICDTCGASYGELGDHNYNYGSWGYTDENGHANNCIYCDAHTELQEHEPNVEAATEDTAKYCTFCGYVIEQQLNHVHVEGTEWKYDSEYHWHDCVGNDGQVYSKAEHTYDNACDDDCNVCNATRTITHDYSKLEKNDTQHWYVCSVCGREKANSRVAHSGGTSDCQHKAECATCGQTYGEFGKHDYDTTVWVSVGDLNHAHKCRLCDAYTDETEHFSLDEATYTEDKLCDACGHKMADALGFELNNVVYKILTNEEGNYTVEVYGNTLTEATEVIIPATVNDEGIEYTVVSIGENAFRYSTYLTGVTICEGVGSIAKSAFENCNALLYAELPQSIYAIGIGAFCNCSELRTVNIPYAVNVIEEWTFNGCHKLENIEIHESIFKIGYRAFYNCYTLPSVVIPYSVEALDENAFYGCTGLEEMRIYSMKVAIGENAIPTDIPMVYCEGAESTAAKYCAENGISFQTHEGEHVDKDKNHICDYGCSEALGVCEDNNFDHNCDYGCEKTYGEHSDGDDNNHLCDYGCQKIADDGCYDTVEDGKCDECGENIIHDCKDDNKNHECDICGTAIGNHSDSITDKDHLCDYGCGAVMENCVPNDDDGDCTTDIICSICGAITTEGAASHIGGNATCTEKAECTVCGKEYGELVPHSHGSEWKNDANEHWNECECGDKANKAAHVDGNSDGKCDTCNYELGTSTPIDPDPPVDPGNDDDGLGTGAIIAIVVAAVAVAVAVVGGGGFAIFWFVIRKKRR